MPDVNRAPRPGCNCTVCEWFRKAAERDADLAANYALYLAGNLVLKDAK